jgi:hypothetical protein
MTKRETRSAQRVRESLLLGSTRHRPLAAPDRHIVYGYGYDGASNASYGWWSVGVAGDQRWLGRSTWAVSARVAQEAQQ